MPLEHSSEGVEQAVGYIVLELNRDVWAGDMGISLWVVKKLVWQNHSLKIKWLLRKIELGGDSQNLCNFVTRAPRKRIILKYTSCS